MSKLKCDYCGKVKKEVSFYIGAALDSRDCVMWEGTGKVSCDCEKCFSQGRNESMKSVEFVKR